MHTTVSHYSADKMKGGAARAAFHHVRKAEGMMMETLAVQQDSPPPMLALRNICKSYKTGFFSTKHTVALQPTTIGFVDGEVTGIVGPNGAGKSTLLKLASGIIPPDHGTICFEGEPIAGEQLREKIGYVSNHVEPYPKMSIRQNLQFRGRIGGLEAEQAAARAVELAERFGISRLIDRSAGVLSTGEGQKLKLCSAMMLDPAILILDEPTTGLDIVASAALFEVVEELKGDGRALVFCSHSPAELERLCDRFVILKQGSIVSRAVRGELSSGTDFEDNLLSLFKENV